MKIPWRFSKRPGYIKGKVLTISYCGQRKILVIFLSLKHHLSVIATLPSHFFPRKPSLQEHVKSSLASSHVPSLMQGFGWHGFLAERNNNTRIIHQGYQEFLSLYLELRFLRAKTWFDVIPAFTPSQLLFYGTPPPLWYPSTSVVPLHLYGKMSYLHSEIPWSLLGINTWSLCLHFAYSFHHVGKGCFDMGLWLLVEAWSIKRNTMRKELWNIL